MSPSLLWFVLAVALFIGEVFTASFLLAPLGLAALAAAAAAALGLGAGAQVGLFAATAVVAVLLSRPLAHRMTRRGSEVRTGVAALVGAEARVVEAVADDAGTGRVKVRGDDWRAVSDNGLPIPAGTRVLVTQVDGTTVRVVPLSDLT